MFRMHVNDFPFDVSNHLRAHISICVHNLPDCIFLFLLKLPLNPLLCAMNCIVDPR